MDFFEVVKKRQSYRGAFADRAVPCADLEKIVQAGMDAPSGKNAQTTRFMIVDAPQTLAKIAGMHPKNKAMQQAKAFIACIVDKQPPGVYEGVSFQVEDCAAAVENMLLSITALGYASVWIDGWLRVKDRAETIGGLLGVPAEKIVRVLLPVGIPAEDYPQPKKMPFAERAWFNRYGEGR